MRIIMAGASGLIGGLVLPLLAGNELTLVGRRAHPSAPSDARQLTGPVERWPELIGGQGGNAFDAAICCLGTTIRIAGSKTGFASIDRDAVAEFAKAAKAAGARQFLMVSSVGANAAQRNFYLRTKGEAESRVKAIGFERVDIFRPGLLRGDRTGPARPGERLMIALAPVTDLLTPAAFDKYRSIAAESVARAIAASVGKIENGVHVHENRAILELAGAA